MTLKGDIAISLCELHFHYGPLWRRSMADDDFWLSVALLRDLSPKLTYLHLREPIALEISRQLWRD